ncbi:elongin A, like [Embiotoca jacksoni]|uniref:elongin A, like n=1 Tax=Embiotoca jacksoni TaxID=100190 RepID=UPI003704913F
MASSSDVVKKVTRFKLQLSDSAEPATVVKILQKLKDLDITFDILAETGIGKTVNSLRRHDQAGEFAKSLVRGWKKLIPKESTSHEGDESESVPVKDKLDDQSCPDDGSVSVENVNSNCLTSQKKEQDSSDEAPFKKTKNMKADSEKEQCEERQRKTEQNNNHKKSQEDQNISQSDILTKKIEIQQEMDNSMKKKCQNDRKPAENETLLGNKTTEDTNEEFRFESGRSVSERETKLKPDKESSKESKEYFSFESSGKCSKILKVAKDGTCSGTSRSSEAQKRNRKKNDQEKLYTLKYKPESKNKSHSKHKQAATKHEKKQSTSNHDEPSMSFESYLNYDVNVFKRKEASGVKKPAKKIKKGIKEKLTKDPGMQSFKSPAASPLKFQESVMHLIDLPLPAALPECDNPSSVDYIERKVEKEPDFCDVSEESPVFTGQRLNKKMQVYSGAKSAFLPAMISLYQHCIRTLQNNINLLYETGGVPFELLEPVLERCTPEQLLRIEECNPIYIGVTDHLWGKHCQKDFKESKLQEYESWKEMYIRLSEERERKFQRLAKTIVSAHSKKPKGRQVKMAFIHTVAKPPRDVRIQQEIHGTAVQQPQQPKCSVKVQDRQSRPSCNEPSRSSSGGSGGSNTQDPRKKTRVAPMMAKSLKTFKKQLGRR